MDREHPPKPNVQPEEDGEDEALDVRGWEESVWHARLFAQTLPVSGKAREILDKVAGACGVEGYMSFDMAEYPNAVPGYRAVGLLLPIHGTQMVTYSEDRWKVNARFPPISPLTIANCFNRFGALRLSFWDRPSHFATVAEVH